MNNFENSENQFNSTPEIIDDNLSKTDSIEAINALIHSYDSIEEPSNEETHLFLEEYERLAKKAGLTNEQIIQFISFIYKD